MFACCYQTLGEYSHLNDQLASDDVAMCLARRFSCSCSDVTKQWIITALLKLSPSISNLSLLLETLRKNSDFERREVLQVSVCSSVVELLVVIREMFVRSCASEKICQIIKLQLCVSSQMIGIKIRLSATPCFLVM